MSSPVGQPGPLWSVMPGWGISANLTPPEIIQGRRVHVVRRRVIAALAVLLIMCVLGTIGAVTARLSASSELSAEQERTSELLRTQSKYAEVIRIHGTVDQVKGQLATLLVNDANYAGLVDRVRSVLPNGLTITELSISVGGGTQGAGSSASSATGAGNLDASGRKKIGTATINGQAPTVGDVAPYVERLKGLPGVVEPFPLTNTIKGAGSGSQFSVQLTLTDELLTHKYDAQKTGGR